MKRKLLVPLFLTAFAFYAGYESMLLLVSFHQEVPIFFANSLPFWMGNVFSLTLLITLFSVFSYCLTGPAKISHRRRLIRSSLLIGAASAVILGILVETSLGILGWTEGRYSPLYPIAPFAISFLLVALGFILIHKPSWLEIFRFANPLCCSKGQRVLLGLYLYFAATFAGCVLYGLPSRDLTSPHFLPLAGFAILMLVPLLVFSIYLFLRSFLGEKPLRWISLGCFVAGLGLFICRWVALRVDPYYLSDGGAGLLPYDVMSFPVSPLLLYLIAVLVPFAVFLFSFRKASRGDPSAVNP